MDAEAVHVVCGVRALDGETRQSFAQRYARLSLQCRELADSYLMHDMTGHPSTTFAILSQNQVAYLDATGSGCETISHVYENGRVTVMFNSFGASPRILRLFCRGHVVERSDRHFKTWVQRMMDSGMSMDKALDGGDKSPHVDGCRDEESRLMAMSLQGIRAVIVLDVFKVQTSCGFGVPMFPHAKQEPYDVPDDIARKSALESSTERAPWKTWDDRPTMPRWAHKMAGKGALEKYREANNWQSLDGCPGLKSARRDRRQWLLLEDTRTWMRMVISGHWGAFLSGILFASALMAILVHFRFLEITI